MNPSGESDTTLPLEDLPKGKLRLLALFGDRQTVFELPERGSVTVGRGEGADLRVEDQAISRKHVAFHLDGTPTVEDLGSANGTRVGGRLLSPGETTALGPGVLVEVGQTLLVLQRTGELAKRIRVDEHPYFEARLEDECGRASRAQGSFAVVRIRAPRVSPVVLEGRLAAATRPGDVLARFGPAEYELLWVDTPADGVADRMAELERDLEKLAPPVTLGAASFPRDGRTGPQLLERLGQGARRPEEGPPAPTVGPMEGLRALVARVAASPLSVLISGETGVGKGVLAREIHARSGRAKGPLVVLDCAELPSSLLEAELFGFERGAFTGANSSKPGMVETADGGTLFLDEIAEMEPGTQAKLLQVLGERQVRRLGSIRSRAVDIRVIAATNRDLEVECERGAFRRDLYFRLAGMTLAIPPLRERRGEIQPLAEMFVAEFARNAGLSAGPKLSDEAVAALLRYSWPGNIRELRNAMERAVVLCGAGPIGAEHLPVERRRALVPVAEPVPALPRAEGERARIEEALAQCGGSQIRAAKLLGMSRRTLVNRLSQLGMPRPRKPRS
jgi:two-component system, NtrC family, response regulator AtoC